MSATITHFEKKKSLTPKLRFNEFKDNWSVFRLGNIAKFSKGKGLSKSDIVENGITECIRYGELYTHYGETINHIKSKTNVPVDSLVLSVSNDIIIPASGETQIDIATASCVLRSGVALGGDLNIIKTDNNGVFLAYYLNNKRKRDIANLAQGISVVHLYSGQLALLSLNIPTLPEQQKIASFLSAVDEKIQQLTIKKALLEEYKKGVMQQLFSGKLRFKDENGKAYPKWEKKKLGDLTDVVVGGTPSSTIPEYWDGQIPWLTSGELKNGEIHEASKFITEAGLKNSSAKLMPKETVLLAMTGATLGRIGFLTFETSGNQSIAGFLPKPTFRSKYLFYNLQFSYHLILSFAGGAAQPGINKNTIENLQMSFPCIEEQQKIASYLTNLDTKIETVATQMAQSQTFKKGLLQQMFV